MSDVERVIFWLCSIISLALSITALMIALPRVFNIHSTMNFDYQAMIVTILGILVTVLIGWQIWATITSRDEIREMRQNAERAERQFNALNAQLDQQRETIPHMIEATRLYTHAHTLRSVGTANVENLREAYALYLEAIAHFLQSNPQDFVDRCLAGMDRCQGSNLGAFNYNPIFDHSFVDRCNRSFESIEDRFGLLSPQQRAELRRLHEIRRRYHTPNQNNV